MLKKSLIVIVTVLAACLLIACGTGNTENAKDSADTETYTGIISALQNEVDLLLEKAEIDRVDTIGGVKFNVGKLCGENVVIAKAGMGKVLAASGISSMLDNYNISRVFFTGIAGAVGDETEVLDQVIGTELVLHDYGQITNDGFEWTVGNVSENGYYACDEQLVELAYNAAVEELGEEHVFKGVIATGDQFVASEDYVKKLKNDFGAIACEMEGAAVAMVCIRYDTPYVVIRSMSDKADGKAHESYNDLMDRAADNSCRIIMRMLEESD